MGTLWFLVLVCGVFAIVVMGNFPLACMAIVVGVVMTLVHKELRS